MQVDAEERQAGGPTVRVDAINAKGHADTRPLESLDDLPETIREIARPGDLVVCLGAGDITTHANALAGKLEG